MCLRSVGVDLGANLVEADERNPSGYGEDSDVVAVHRRLLGVAEVGATDGLTWHDWGWPTGNGAGQMFGAARASEMRRYVERRAAALHSWAWGWKDPRTTLFLESWAGVAPAAHFVLLYRSPVGVARSLRRLPLPGNVQLHADDVWRMYNEHAVRFARAHPERSIVIHTDGFLRAPELVIRHILDRVGADVDVGAPVVADAIRKSVDLALADRSRLDDERGEIPPSLAGLWARLQELDEAAPVAARSSRTPPPGLVARTLAPRGDTYS
jgi:hypothetical protein